MKRHSDRRSKAKDARGGAPATSRPTRDAIDLAEMDVAIAELVAEFGDGDFLLDAVKPADPAASARYKVSGHGMRSRGILDGDTVFVDRARAPAEGDTVVVSLDGTSYEARAFGLDGSRAVLRLDSSPDGDVRLPLGSPKIQGVAKVLARKM